jgi:hypothetical protein
MANLDVMSRRSVIKRIDRPLETGDIPALNGDTSKKGKWSRRRSLVFIIAVSVAIWAGLAFLILS